MTARPDTPHPPKLIEQVVARLRVKHYSIRTETQYLQWIKRFILFHGKRHPQRPQKQPRFMKSRLSPPVIA